MHDHVHPAPAENDHENLWLTQTQRTPCPNCSINLVRETKSSTANCSALLSSNSSDVTSTGKFRGFSALRNVFLLLLNPCFTTLRNNTSSHPSSFLLFRFKRITA